MVIDLKRRKDKNIEQPSSLVAIDMGSHSFRAMAAEVTPDDSLRILGVEESCQKRCVNSGVIENTTDAGFMINSVLKLLSNRIRVDQLHSTFVCVGGRILKVYPVCSKRDQIRQREISQHLLDDMEAECREKIERKHPDVFVLDVIPYFYKLDGVEQDHEPTADQRAALVEGHYIAFVGKREYEEKVVNSFNRSTIRVEQMYVRPDALLNALASDDDMAKGCAILDLGAQTTTLSVFKGTQYLQNQVEPLGSNDITKAIASLGLSMQYAEHLKCTYGVAAEDMVQTNRRYVLPSVSGDKVCVTTKELAAIISSKLDEILQPLMQVLNKEAERLKVLYITGGGAMLNGVVEYIQRMTSVSVDYGSHAAWITPDSADEYCMPKYASLVGTLLLGAAYRKKHPYVKPYEKDKRIIDSIKERTLDIFTEQDFSKIEDHPNPKN